MHTDTRLQEGRLADEDVMFEDPDQALRYAFENPQFRYKGGESVEDLQQRAVRALEEILHQHQGNRIALGTHGYIFMSIMNYYETTFTYDFWSKTTKPDIYKATFKGNTYKKIERLWSV